MFFFAYLTPSRCHRTVARREFYAGPSPSLYHFQDTFPSSSECQSFQSPLCSTRFDFSVSGEREDLFPQLSVETVSQKTYCSKRDFHQGGGGGKKSPPPEIMSHFFKIIDSEKEMKKNL